MCPSLLVTNDRVHEYEDIQANIFTPGQGFCLQRLRLKNIAKFRFNSGLAYGSWYDVQIITYTSDGEEFHRYLRKGIYLKYRKKITMAELTDEEYRDDGNQWTCSHCKMKNIGSVAICERCHRNKSQRIISILSMIPVLGIPFSITNATLKCGQAAQSNKISDEIDAGVTVIFALIDVVTAPFIVGALARIPAKVAAQTGIQITARTIFTEAGKPILKEAVKELGKDGIVGGLTVTKAAVKTGIQISQRIK